MRWEVAQGLIGNKVADMAATVVSVSIMELLRVCEPVWGYLWQPATYRTFFHVETRLFSDYLLPVTLFLVTFSIATTLEVSDFRNIFRKPRQMLIGLFAQIILLPLAGFLVAWLWPSPATVKVGLIIIAASPGGATANLINHLLRGNVALSLSLTATNSLVILLTIPLLVNLALWAFMGSGTDITFPIGVALQEIFVVTVVPTVLGVTFRTYRRQLAESLEPPLRYVLPVLLGVVFLGVIFLEKSQVNEMQLTFTDYLVALPPALVLNVGTMLMGYYFARSLRLSRRNGYTIAIEVGLHNSALAVFVAVSLLGSKALGVVPLVYATFSFFTTAAVGYLLKTYGRRRIG